jgi:hypothetical protein
MAIGWAMAMLAAATPATPSPDAAAIERLVERFNTARTDFDAAALADTLAPEYQEISPVGDVDDRAKVLGFYRPDRCTRRDGHRDGAADDHHDASRRHDGHPFDPRPLCRDARAERMDARIGAVHADSSGEITAPKPPRSPQSSSRGAGW